MEDESRGRKASPAKRAAAFLHEDRRLLFGALAFALASLVAYAVARYLRLY